MNVVILTVIRFIMAVLCQGQVILQCYVNWLACTHCPTPRGYLHAISSQNHRHNCINRLTPQAITTTDCPFLSITDSVVSSVLLTTALASITNLLWFCTPVIIMICCCYTFFLWLYTEICDPQCIHGSCVDGECECFGEWEGDRCHIRKSWAHIITIIPLYTLILLTAICYPPAGCIHGVCVAPNHCSCYVGWTGSHCSSATGTTCEGMFICMQ